PFLLLAIALLPRWYDLALTLIVSLLLVYLIVRSFTAYGFFFPTPLSFLAIVVPMLAFLGLNFVKRRLQYQVDMA
ncbi:MAG: hypothetical protein RLN67_05420, partial [Algiphilus sp.]